MRAISELPGPRGLPLRGNVLQLDTGRMHTILSAWADEFGPTYRYRIANRDALVVADPELINEILRKSPGWFSAHGMRTQVIVHEHAEQRVRQVRRRVPSWPVLAEI